LTLRDIECGVHQQIRSLLGKEFQFEVVSWVETGKRIFQPLREMRCAQIAAHQAISIKVLK
jgi:hypothetical protein